MKVGYARVSTKGQTPENQISKLAETGCELFFEEKTSGAKKRRPALEAMLEQIRADDIVGVTSPGSAGQVNARTAAHRRGIYRKNRYIHEGRAE